MSDNSLFGNETLPVAGLALARKWRPRDFASLLGQDHVVQALSHALDQNRLHHAWLFTGTRGVGKTTISRILAKSLNCTGTLENPVSQPTSMPCGQCAACTEIDAGRFVDYVEMDAASNRGIADMISLLEKAVYGPTSGRFKVFMIDEVHMLTNQAFNSMLKTLEEPPAHLKFILATTDPQKIPVTVLSRCLQFNLKQMPSKLIVRHLKTVLGAEHIPIHDSALKIIAKSARGSMRDALSLTDQAIAYSSGNMTEEAVRAMLGSLDDQYLIRIVDALANHNGQDLIAISNEMGLMSISFVSALQDLASLLQKIAMAQIIPDSVLEEWPEAQEIVRLAQLLSKEEVQLFYQIAITSRADLLLAPEEETGFMMALLRMLAFMPDDGHGPNEQVKPQAQARRAVSVPPVKENPVNHASHTSKVNSNSPVTLESKVPAQSTLSPQSWQQMIKGLQLKGIEGQFALQTALISFEDKSGTMFIKLATDILQLATPSSIALLTQALAEHLNKPVKITLEKNDQVMTVANLEAQDQENAQTKLESKLAMDPLLEKLKSELGVRVIQGSIRPLS
jgi:DNA polymerase-3 subunit gamma/tau